MPRSEPSNRTQRFNILPKATGPSIQQFIRRVYHRLPIVRELHHLRATVADAATAQRRMAQEEFVARLLREDRYARTNRLNRHEHQVFSQNGEDGIIQEIFRRISVAHRRFVEIGVGDGQRNNTTYLVTQGWRGFWIEGNPRSVRSIRRSFRAPLGRAQLTLLESLVTRENVSQSLDQLGVPAEIDLLSLDVDRNTYWILSAILPALRPRVLVVEYNATFPPDVEWTVEYDATRWWNRSSYFGASLKAYELLARQHGLCLVGCDLTGVNAFFVREELCGDRFEEPFAAETHYEPARYFLARTHGHPPCFSDSID